MVVKGNVVLVRFPSTDRNEMKLRPSVILWVDPMGKDVVICAITGQNIDRLEAGEFRLDIADPEFPRTGLRVSSKVRTTRIATLDRQRIVRRLGKLSDRQMLELNIHIVKSLQLISS